MAQGKVARVVWTEPALADLDTIADYMALDNQATANRLVQKVLPPWNASKIFRHWANSSGIA
jgi:hypothetical protein